MGNEGWMDGNLNYYYYDESFSCIYIYIHRMRCCSEVTEELEKERRVDYGNPHAHTQTQYLIGKSGGLCYAILSYPL